MGYTHVYARVPDRVERVAKVLSAYSIVSDEDFLVELLRKYGISRMEVEDIFRENEVRRAFKKFTEVFGARAYKITPSVLRTRFSPPEKVFDYPSLFTLLVYSGRGVEEFFENIGFRVEGKNRLRPLHIPSATIELTEKGIILYYKDTSTRLGDYMEVNEDYLLVYSRNPVGSVLIRGEMVYGRVGYFVFAYKDKVFFKGNNIPLKYSFIASYHTRIPISIGDMEVEVGGKKYTVSLHPPMIVLGIPYKFVDVNEKLLSMVREVNEVIAVELVFGSHKTIREVLGILDFKPVRAEITMAKNYALVEVDGMVTGSRVVPGWEIREVYVKDKRIAVVGCREPDVCYMDLREGVILAS